MDWPICSKLLTSSFNPRRWPYGGVKRTAGKWERKASRTIQEQKHSRTKLLVRTLHIPLISQAVFFEHHTHHAMLLLPPFRDIAWDHLMSDKFTKLRDFIFATPDDFARFRSVVVNVVLATVRTSSMPGQCSKVTILLTQNRCCFLGYLRRRTKWSQESSLEQGIFCRFAYKGRKEWPSCHHCDWAQ